MTIPSTSCPSCSKPLPTEALYCPSCGVATPTAISGGTTASPVVASLPSEDPEHRIRLQRALGDAFRLGRLLGRGGFGEVYAATEPALAREVAVKVLRADLMVTRALTDRFAQEARAMAKVRHPNIIPIYGVGDGGGFPYFVMPLISGESLRAYVQRVGALPFDDVRRILCEVADALAYAHEAGLLHRDVKPDNILLEGKERRAIVTDFGLAKAMDGDEPRLTATGMFVGSPLYMSPERADGTTGIDQRADIYSLGVVGYEMVTGVVPFAGNSLEVLFKHKHDLPRPIAEVRPDAPPGLVSVIDRALMKSPGDRWGTARDMAHALQHVDQLQPELEAVTISEPSLLVHFNVLYKPGMVGDELYDNVRGVWDVGEQRERARYAFAVYHGRVIEVYEIEQWHRAGTTRYVTRFIDLQRYAGRWEFTGHVAPDRIRDKYVGKSVARYFEVDPRNPVRLVNVGSA